MITSWVVLACVALLLVLLVRGVAQPAALFGLFATSFFFAGLIEQSPTAHREAETAKAHRG